MRHACLKTKFMSRVGQQTEKRCLKTFSDVFEGRCVAPRLDSPYAFRREKRIMKKYKRHSLREMVSFYKPF